MFKIWETGNKVPFSCDGKILTVFQALNFKKGELVTFKHDEQMLTDLNTELICLVKLFPTPRAWQRDVNIYPYIQY